MVWFLILELEARIENCRYIQRAAKFVTHCSSHVLEHLRHEFSVAIEVS